MCIHRGECPHADMTCSTVTFCPLADDEVYVGPVQGPFLFQHGENNYDTVSGTAFGAGQPFCQAIEQSRV